MQPAGVRSASTSARAGHHLFGWRGGGCRGRRAGGHPLCGASAVALGGAGRPSRASGHSRPYLPGSSGIVGVVLPAPGLRSPLHGLSKATHPQQSSGPAGRYARTPAAPPVVRLATPAGAAPRWPGSAQRRAIATTPTQASASSTRAGWGLGGGSRYSVSVRPEDYNLIVYPGSVPRRRRPADRCSLRHKAFVIASPQTTDSSRCSTPLRRGAGGRGRLRPQNHGGRPNHACGPHARRHPQRRRDPGHGRGGGSAGEAGEFHPASGARVRQAVEVDVRVGDVEMRWARCQGVARAGGRWRCSQLPL